ncbi:MAG: response regulator [Actinobacteria bacterium]|nr:response regulator [Actinomycetota bacterium]MSZ99854.1 response regulator [Actinomycetota bacterium]MTA10516.1 response regulator [Actinomycetota bacterium]MTA69989.1 response regulator [Actinomycetota bacterium]MTB11340.1 response regulator [Actinomycetota bacterium]
MVHVILATDADWLVDDVVAALGGPETTFTHCRDGRSVVGVVKARTPDLVILDLQSGTMGGVAVTMDLRLDESGGTLPHVAILMLLDRAADIHMARRSGADGWLIKPLDPLRLRRASKAIAGGGCFAEGLPTVDEPVSETTEVPEAEPATAG